jgi:hypothetical protein
MSVREFLWEAILSSARQNLPLRSVRHTTKDAMRGWTLFGIKLNVVKDVRLPQEATHEKRALQVEKERKQKDVLAMKRTSPISWRYSICVSPRTRSLKQERITGRELSNECYQTLKPVGLACALKSKKIIRDVTEVFFFKKKKKKK